MGGAVQAQHPTPAAPALLFRIFEGMQPVDASWEKIINKHRSQVWGENVPNCTSYDQAWSRVMRKHAEMQTAPSSEDDDWTDAGEVDAHVSPAQGVSIDTNDSVEEALGEESDNESEAEDESDVEEEEDITPEYTMTVAEASEADLAGAEVHMDAAVVYISKTAHVGYDTSWDCVIMKHHDAYQRTQLFLRLIRKQWARVVCALLQVLTPPERGEAPTPKTQRQLPRPWTCEASAGFWLAFAVWHAVVVRPTMSTPAALEGERQRDYMLWTIALAALMHYSSIPEG